MFKIWYCERRYTPDDLTLDRQWLSTGGQYLHVPAFAKQCIHENRAGVQQVLAIVQDQQQAPTC
jgi:hypothetical protein